MNPPELLLVLIGFGHVGRRLVRLLDEMDDRLDFDTRVVAIATRRHGSVIDPGGVDPARAVAAVEAGRTLDQLDPDARKRSGIDVVRQAADVLADEAADGRVVVVEASVLDIERGEPAVSHVRAAIDGQMHVVSVNKGPAAFAYHALADLAAEADRRFLFEGAVMDGVPLFNLVRETMPGVRINGFRGVINTTANFVLSALERGQDFDAAVGEMQARGIAEADPRLDVDGWDTAAKTAAIVNVLMGGSATPHDVVRTGIGEVSAEDVARAKARDRRIRLVASATRHGRGIDARVEPELLDRRDPLAGLDDTENAVYLSTDILGEVGIVQRTGTLTQTAFAVVSDLARVAADEGRSPVR
jgi:homoserine dehydrogenase